MQSNKRFVFDVVVLIVMPSIGAALLWGWAAVLIVLPIGVIVNRKSD